MLRRAKTPEEEGGDGALDYKTQWQIDDSYKTTATGLQYKDEVVGTGDSSPEEGGTIELHYSFWFDDFSDEESRETGKKYFSTRGSNNPKGTPMSFQFGDTQILKGWSEGMETMKAGGKRILIIPPELAYGDDGIPQRNVFPAVPGGSYLRFEVELVKVDNSAFTKFRRWLPKPSSLPIIGGLGMFGVVEPAANAAGNKKSPWARGASNWRNRSGTTWRPI